MTLIDVRKYVLCLCGLLGLTGCHPNFSNNPAVVSSPTPAPSPAPPPPSKLLPQSVFVSDDSSSLLVLAFHQTSSNASAVYLTVPGSLPAVDDAGNLYVLNCHSASPSNCPLSVDVYPPDAVLPGQPLRSLQTNMTRILDMKVSKSGEIFVSDGQNIAVYAQGATGNDHPIRSIQSNQAGSLAVDSADNIYVKSYDTISVFGPTATGMAQPLRVINGPHTQMANEYWDALGIGADGNLYVLCYTDATDGANKFRVLEFGPNANGDVAPLRYVTTPDMDVFYNGLGVAEDSAGTVYVSASLTKTWEATVFEFPAGSSGSVTASNLIGFPTWGDNAGGIAVH